MADRFIIKMPNDREGHLMPQVVGHCNDGALLDGFAETYARLYPDNRIVVADLTGVVLPDERNAE